MDQKECTIFIVDDDASIRKALKRLIKVAGFNAKTFDSANEFVDSGHSHTDGVLILDVRMPGMSGLELQKYLINSGSDMPVIFISAHEDIPVQRMALQAGAIDFLKKPFEEAILLEAVQRALSRKSLSKKQLIGKDNSKWTSIL